MDKPTPAMKRELRKRIAAYSQGKWWVDEEICGQWLEAVFEVGEREKADGEA